MPSNTDELLTKYTLDPTSYVSGGQKVLGTTSTLISTLANAVKASDTLQGKVLGLSVALGTLGSAAALAAAAGLAKVTSFAIEQASSTQLLTARFAALNGSFDVATTKLAGLQSLARSKSLFSLDELQNAGGILEEAGLNVSRILPLVNTLGNALGGTQGKALAAATALRNIAEGADPLRTLRQFGISSGDFAGAGGAFNKNGKLVKDSQATFSEIESIVKRKFGNIDGYIQNTFARRVEGLKNSFDVAAAGFGTAFLGVFGKVADNVSKFFGYLSDSGRAASVGKNLATGLGDLLGKGDFFNKAISLGMAALENLPTILSESWKYLVEVGATFKTLFLSAVDSIGAGLHSVVNSAVTALYGGINSIRHTVGDLLKTASSVIGLLPGDKATQLSANLYGQGARLLMPHNDLKAPRFFEDSKGNNTLTAENAAKSLGSLGRMIEPAFLKDIFNKGRDIYHGYGGAAPDIIQKAVSTGGVYYGNKAPSDMGSRLAAGGNANPFFTSLYTPIMEQIANNTKITADNSGKDLKKFALGGGPLGQIGVTPVEFQAFRNGQRGRAGGGNQISIRVEGKSVLEEFVHQIATQAIHGAVRQGLLKT